VKIAVIGGTGIYDPKLFGEGDKREVETPFGRAMDITVVKLKGWKGREVVFIPRHGAAHGVPPHKINYRKNIYALKLLGVTRVIATNSVGCINPELKPRDIVLPHDFIDFTKGRVGTFYDAEAVHVDMREPYCRELKEVLLRAAKKVKIEVKDGGVYGCTEGPRFETPAEIRMMGQLGCDLVGMTGLPEAVLAKEQEICYASICTVTNYAAGISTDKLTASEVLEIITESQKKLRNFLAAAVLLVPEKRRCTCKDALQGAKVKSTILPSGKDL
jgi:5'-methylthioadenosine phosphorylase